VAIGAAALALGACTGQIGDPNDPGGPNGGSPTTGGSPTGGNPTGGNPGGTPTTGGGPTGGMVDPMSGKWQPPACNMSQPAFGNGRIWQITDQEYVNAVRDVLGITLTGTDAEITAAASNSGEFSNMSEGGAAFSLQVATNYQNAALAVAKQATVAAKMTQLNMGNATTAATDAQLNTFLSTKVARLWKRPVQTNPPTNEVTLLKTLYNSGTAAADGGPANAFSLLLQAVLQSSSFLYRTELGSSTSPATQTYQLTPFEAATALSMMFLDSVPDDTLWQKATAGNLLDPTVLAGEVDRLMGTQPVKDGIAQKIGYWLWTERVPARDKDTGLFPQYTAAVQQSVYQSGQMFVKDLIDNGKLWDIFTATKVFANKDISTVYGIGNVGTTAFTAVDTSGQPERTMGILSQPAFIAGVHKRAGLTDPIHMGLFMLQQLVCGGDNVGEIPPPPADALDQAAKMTGTERELVGKRAMMSCGACHGGFDSMGLTFQAFDAIGRYSQTRQVQKDMTGKFVWVTTTSIDETGAIPDRIGKDLQGPLANLKALATKFNADGPNRRIAYCAGKTLATYAMGSTDATTLNSCGLQQAKESLFQTGSFTSFYRALATSPGFYTRNPG
jgi:hypothetical protein